MGKVILITHQKGGVGKSVLTYNLAVIASEKHKTCIIDYDYQGTLISIKEVSSIPIYNRDEIEKVAKMDYDYIFIDSPPYIFAEINELVKISDTVIIPTKAGIADALAIERTIDIIKQNRLEEKSVIVFNMVKHNAKINREVREIIEEHNIKIADTKISDLTIFNVSIIENGVKANETANFQIRKLAREILNLK